MSSFTRRVDGIMRLSLKVERRLEFIDITKVILILLEENLTKPTFKVTRSKVLKRAKELLSDEDYSLTNMKVDHYSPHFRTNAKDLFLTLFPEYKGKV